MQRRKSGAEAPDNETLWLLSKSLCGDSVSINVCKTEPEAESFKIREERLHNHHVDSLRSMHSLALRRFLCLLGVPSVLDRPEDNSSL